MFSHVMSGMCVHEVSVFRIRLIKFMDEYLKIIVKCVQMKGIHDTN